MSKNLIYMVAIDHSSSTITNSNYAQYAIKSWQKYCDTHGIDFIIRSQMPSNVSRPVWTKSMIHEFADTYDKIGIVDSDTMVGIAVPNIFDQYNDDEFCGVSDLIDMQWILRSIKSYQVFFPQHEMDIYRYINAGIVFFGNQHLQLYETLSKLYADNREKLDAWEGGVGREQTLFNYLLQQSGYKLKLLSPAWNTMGLINRGLLKFNWQLHIDTMPYFLKYGKFIHFTGFPPEHREQLMRDTEAAIDHYIKLSINSISI